MKDSIIKLFRVKKKLNLIEWQGRLVLPDASPHHYGLTAYIRTIFGKKTLKTWHFVSTDWDHLMQHVYETENEFLEDLERESGSD